MLFWSMWLPILEWSAFLIGTAGSILWAFGKSQLVVSVLWAVSAILWIAFAASSEIAGLALRDALALAIYVIGIRTYLQERKQSAVSLRSQ